MKPKVLTITGRIKRQAEIMKHLVKHGHNEMEYFYKLRGLFNKHYTRG